MALKTIFQRYKSSSVLKDEREMKRYYLLLKRHGVVLLTCVFLSTSLHAAEETAPGIKGMSEEEFTPAKEVLIVRYVQIKKPSHMDVESLKDAFKNANGVKITLQNQDKAFAFGGGSVKSAEVKAIHDGVMIYFQISWKDPTKNARPSAVPDSTERTAIRDPLKSRPITPAEHFS